MSFFAELKRRNVFKVGVAYAIVAWLLIEVVATIFPILALPDWSIRLITVVIILGFPIAIFLAWAYELTPEGIKPTQSVAPAESITHLTGQKLNFSIIGLMALAIVFLVIDNYVLIDKQEVTKVETVKTQPVTEPIPTPAEEPRKPDILPNSVAVLPFANMSPDENNAYFAAGLHEEILNQLAKLSQMTVIARTTMSQYAFTEKSIQQIAHELKVKSVMEGSVRYADGHIRVTAQLIDPNTGGHLWSDTYDHEFKNIFAIESDIAMNVANAMVVEFSLEEQSKIEAIPTKNTQAYALYLEATTLSRGTTGDEILLGLEKIDQALKLDPNFALAWVTKSWLHFSAQVLFSKQYVEHQLAGERAARRAIELDPGIANAHVALASMFASRGDLLQAHAENLRAKELDRNSGNPFIAMAFGQFAEPKLELEHFRKVNPLFGNTYLGLMTINEIQGNREEALALYEYGRGLFNDWGGGDFNAMVIHMGMRDHDWIKERLNKDSSRLFNKEILGYIDQPEKALVDLHARYAGDTYTDPISRIVIAVWAAYFGDQQLALASMSDIIDSLAVSASNMWRPLFHDMRQLDGFKELMREKGFVTYWQKYGWSELCKPVKNNDFECE